MFDDVVQLPGHHAVRVDRSRDSLLTDFGKATLNNRYLLPGEHYQDLFARVASYYGADQGHAQRIYDYISRHWFMPATPILSNGGTSRGLPISCFLNEAEDSLEGIVGLWNENVWLASKGGGIGSYWGNLRSIGENIGRNGKTSGVIPFIRVMDSLTLAISQGSLRRGSAAVYLPVWHPEIEEFTEMRRPTGGDPNRKALNLHHGVLITDAFMRAVEADEEWPLLSPKDHSIIRKVSARGLWIRILTARMEQGEPYVIYSDHVNRARPEHHKLAGLEVKTSNLCAEITLPTGIDHHGKNRTAVCCLSSLNLETWDEWKDDPQFIEDVMLFL
ncbi:MAG: ribonucleotide reductase N-terminal alpha domain-containing protein, partial [Gluconobacter sp.]